MQVIDDDDPMGPARGVLTAVVASLPLWLVIGAVVWWMVRGSR
jgi:hypothetical protein